MVGVFHSHWSVVDGRLLFWSVVGFSTALGRWSVVFNIGGRWFFWSVVGYFLCKWSVVDDRWSVVSLWSVGGGRCFCTTLWFEKLLEKFLADIKISFRNARGPAQSRTW